MADNSDICFLSNFTSPQFTYKQTLTAGILTFLLYTIFTALCATIFVLYQRRRGHFKITLQTNFNAGGDMPFSLLVSTITSQWTWASNLLGAVTAGYQYGLSGSYWYSASATIQIILFSIVCMEMRIKAPGARTFLQVIQVRFDKKTHILYCIFAIITNYIVAAAVLVGAVSSVNYSFTNIAPEYAIVLLIIPTIIFVFIGGLGGFFYVSYFTTLSIIMCIMLLFFRIFYSGQSSPSDVGSIDAIFDRLDCTSYPDNYQNSFKTFLSLDGLLMGIIGIVGNFGTVFIDQSYWQLNATTSPKKSSIAFIVSGFIWFFLPFVFGTTLSTAYVYLNSIDLSDDILSDSEISSGLVAPAVAGIILGAFGNYIVALVLIFTGTIATGAEILAPFKPHLANKDSMMCILCEKIRGKVGTNKCVCLSITLCKNCDQDDKDIKSRKINQRACPTHALYRDYEDYLNKNKKMTILFVSFVMLIISLFVYNINLNLGWLYSFMGIIVGPAVLPVTISLFWARVNSFAMFVGQISGCLVGIISWILASVIIYGGLDLQKSGKLVSMLVGNVTSILTGGVVVTLITLFTTKPLNVDQKLEIWEKTRDIDSPLLPWYEIYGKYMKFEPDENLIRPSLMEVENQLKKVKDASWIIAFAMTFFFLIVIPLISINFSDYTLAEFKLWLIFGQIFIILAFIYFLIGPLVEYYFIKIVKAFKRTKKVAKIPVPNRFIKY